MASSRVATSSWGIPLLARYSTTSCGMRRLAGDTYLQDKTLYIELILVNL